MVNDVSDAQVASAVLGGKFGIFSYNKCHDQFFNELTLFCTYICYIKIWHFSHNKCHDQFLNELCCFILYIFI
jgi:hypothetical protein